MKQVIKIDRSTIKKNANSGVMVESVPVSQDTTITTNLKLADWMLEDDHKMGFAIESITMRGNSDGERSTEYRISVFDSEVLDKFIEFGKENKKTQQDTFAVNTVINRVEIKSMFPQREYSFGYVNELVECGNCEAKVFLKDIEEVEDEDGYSSEDKCPICGDIDTFDFEYETIEQALKLW